MNLHSSSIVFFFAFATALPTFAGDGVLEINHACASSDSGCFVGDAGGYPVEISGQAGRSYRLTSDLRLDTPAFDASSVAVAISGSGITLDLGGFSILGPCLNCASGGTGVGVDAPFSEGIEVRNGRISAMGGSGLSLGWRSTVDGLRAESNLGSGVVVKDGSRIRNTQSFRNGAAGISVGDSSTVERSTIWSNGTIGIEAPSFATIVENSVSSNLGVGIVVGNGALVRANNVASNSGTGIFTSSGALIESNVLYANGIGAPASPGINAGTGSLIRANSVRASGSFGISLGQSGYADNVIFDNQGGTVSGGANLGGNYCNPGCP